MQKTKILLGAYIDSVNAQDINCYNIAKHINKKKFDVQAFVHNQDVAIPGVVCHKVSNNRLLKNFQKLLLMMFINADIYYLPRVERVDIIFSKFSRKKITSSVEIQTVYENHIYKKFFNQYINGYFCISKFLERLNEKKWGKKVKVIYLGVDSKTKYIEKKVLKKIAFIGSVEERKRPFLFLSLAEKFNDLDFEMIGDGSLLPDVKTEAKEKGINNITFYGRLNNGQVLDKLNDIDLLVITSKQEGLPKVILEAASRCVPTVYISEFYKVDYIKNGENGYGVIDLNDLIDKIEKLRNNNEHYLNLTRQVYKLANKYSWDSVITDYEKFFKILVDNAEETN